MIHLPNNQAGLLEEGAGSSMIFAARQPRWIVRPRRSRNQAGRCGLFGQAVDRLEGRQLLTTIPAIYAPNGSMLPIGPTIDPDGLSKILDDPTSRDPSIASSLTKGSDVLIPPPGSPKSFSLISLIWRFRSENDLPTPGVGDRPPGILPPDVSPRSADSPPKGRAVISEASVLVQGTPTTELAIANNLEGSVTVLQGTTVVSTIQGLVDPEGVKLADMNNDGTPDLIIAESGRNRVLIYRGLAGGGFGPEVTGGRGFAVGIDPVGLTVGDLDGGGSADLIVANKGSNDISILDSDGTGADWTLTPDRTIKAGEGPFKTVLVDLTHQAGASRALVVCNHDSADAYFYQVAADGHVNPTPSQVLTVGQSPINMFLGWFSRQSELDLVTVNDNSDRLTYIGGVFTPHPNRSEVATGIANPTAAVALSVNATGTSDLVVAGGNGQVAFLQPTDHGLTLTGLSAPTGLNNVTAIAAGGISNGGLNLFEVSGTTNAIAILQFNLGDLSPFRATPSVEYLSSLTGTDNPVVVEMVPTGGRLLDLVGILRNGPDSASSPDALGADRAGGRSRSTAQGLSATDGDPESAAVLASSRPSEDEAIGSGETPVPWTRFVLGLDAALDSFRGEVAPLADSDSWDVDDRSTVRTTVDRSDRLFDSPDEALRLPPGEAPASDPGRPRPRTMPNSEPTGSTGDSTDLTTAAVGSGLAVRLLINASPPKPPRPGSGKRSRTKRLLGMVVPWPEILPPTDPHS